MIDTKNNLKYFELIIDSKLSFKSHLNYLEQMIDNLTARISNMLWLNRKIKLKNKRKIYINVFLPIILYDIKIWYPFIKTKITYLEELNKIQRKIIKTITNSYRLNNKS